MGDTSTNGQGRSGELSTAQASGQENGTPQASASGSVSTPADAARLQNLANDPETKVTVSSDGHLTLVSKDGREFPLPGADPLMATFRANPWPLINLLNDDRNALADFVKAATQNDGSANATFVKLTEILKAAIPPPPHDPDEVNSSSSDARSVTFQQLGALNGTNSPLSGNPLSPFTPASDETPQLGGDDLKRGEFGAKGQNTGAGVGSGVGHLTGLGDEEPGLRNGEKITTSDNSRFPGLQTGVGTGIDHLWLLGDFEYYRASTDHLDVDGILPDHGGAPVYGPLITDKNPEFRLVEDHDFQGRIFDATGVRVLNIKTSMDPDAGTVKLNPDGTFEYTPKYGYSGETSFDYSFTDPRTGEKITGTVELVVEAVADPASISGAAVTPEDTIVPTPVDVSLNDPDGSETIREVVISGIPPGTTLDWDHTNPANFALQPDGSYIVTGDTDDIIAVLKTLTFDPAHDFSGQVVLGIDVTTIESNADPKVKGYLDTALVHHDYVIDVIPVADMPPVTGDTETTDEDTRVHLDDLAGNLTDIDGSEVLSFEISNVDPNATLEDTAGTEYPFTTQLDGTKTYTLTPAQIGDVFFDPPPNEHGVFDMTIHATATEQANNDQATNTAPIEVTVTPVEDLPTISGSSTVDEDTAVNFGGDIGIGPVDDADGSESITNVTITGIPAGVVPTGTNVGGATFVFTPGTGTITVTGGTEQDIRDTVASLALTPPGDSDVNIDLQVTVTTTDGPVVATTPPYTHTIAVAAIADGSNISGVASGNEDSPIDLPITATLKDTDGSETYDYAEVTVPAGHTLTETALPNGITKTAIAGGFRYEPGPATTTAQFQDFLANNLQVQAPLDSDVDFSVDVAIGTIESTLSGGEVTLLRKEDTATVDVTVLPVVDTPTINTVSAMNEDAIVDPNAPPVGANIVPHPVGDIIEAGISLGETAVGDTSEEITQIEITGIPEGASITYTPVGGGVPITVIAPAGGTDLTLNGGTESQIRTALETLTIVPPAHDDTNIPLGVNVTVRDNDPDNAADTTSATFNGTHTIAVAAVADGSNISGVASGNEDSPIDLPITATLKDTDGSETYDFAEVTVPAGHTLTETALPNGITKTAIAGGFRYEPGPATTTAQFQDFLANNLQVQAPLDSDVDFSVAVVIGTIESTLSGGEVTLLRKEDTATINVTVLPVVDTPTINSTSSMNEDAIIDPNAAPVGANIAAHTVGTSINTGISLGETAVGDTSEEITQIVLTGIPLTATIGAGMIAGVTIDQTVAGQITISGPNETDIRAALQTITIIPPAHDDSNIPIGVAVTVRDNDPDNAGDTTSQVFNGTHTLTVAAVADAPTGNGAGAGLEDQDIPVVINVSRPDNTDGSESIKDVVITGVPSGFTLSESSALGGTLTDNGGGSYTVTGATDAEIQDLLTKLSLDIDGAPGAPREHLDDDFSLAVTVTTQEDNPSEAGIGEVARLENSVSFNVPITVTAVADPVTHSGNSTIVEDITGTIGTDISYARVDATEVDDTSEYVTQVTVTGFQVGSVVTYDDVSGTPQTLNIVTGAEVVTLAGPHSAVGETAIRTALDTLNVKAPAESDVNFDLAITATTTDNDLSTNTTNWTHTVVVQAVADAPVVASGNITGNEDTAIVLPINADRSSDGNTDGSETLSVRITLPTDGTGPVGTIIDNGTVANGVTITDEGGGVYLVEGPGAGTPAAEEALIDTFLATGLSFQPRPQWAGSFTGANGILIEAISTEAATGGELADGPTFGGADGTSKTETVATRVDLTVNPVLDGITFANASTTVEENNGSSNPSDPDLVVPLGARMGFTLVDLDGSQDLDVTFSNLPTTAVVMFGATTIPNDGTPTAITIGGVDTIVTLDNAGNLRVDGPDAAKAITAINTLTLTLLDDDDANFTVGINGTTTEAIGGASTPVVGTHDVIVQAVADTPDTDTGTPTKATVQEDSAFVGYPATIALNDTDGSETYQSVVVEFSTVGAGAIPEVQFGVSTGIALDTTVPGQVTLTGGTTAQMQAALASLQVRPGANNGEDITVTVTTTVVESNPSEGVGGVVGPEVTVPTATNSDSFVIPVDPVPEVPSITVPANLPGTEDTLFNLGGISISTATNDPDGSESNFIEIDTSSFPTGTVFSTGGTTHSTIVSGFLRIPESDLAGLQMQTPLNYSGTVTLDVRAVVVDTSATNTVTSVSATSPIAVAVVPVADPITTPSASVGVEDNGPVAFGADLDAGLQVTDSVVGGPQHAPGNVGGDETLSQVSFVIPADTATQTYAITGAFAPVATGTIAGSGTAEVTFDLPTRTYTITSTIITGAADPATLTDAQRATAEADIRATLATFEVEMGPTHSDLDGLIAVTATALDVKDGVFDTQDTSFNHTVRIQAVADTPTIAASAGPNVTEDAGNIALNINPGRSPDQDNSETLSVRVTVPSDALGPVGTIANGALPPGISVTDQGAGIYLIEATGADVATREATLDAFLNAGGLSFDPRDNWSGQIDITIEAISTEAATGNQVAPGAFGGPDGTSKTETVETTVTVTVAPDVDTPTVKGNGVGLEDTNIPIPMSVTLGDKDGSESYTMKITGGVPAGAKIFGAGGIEIVADGFGDYNLTPADVAALEILPPLHYSSAHDGDITLVTETTVTDDNGVTTAQQTFTNNITVEVQGIADAPAPSPVNIVMDEDEDVPLGAAILASLPGGVLNGALVDGDGSETLSVVLSGLPPGVIPSVGTFIGGGTFQIDAADIGALTLPVPEHFSGDYVAIAGLTVTMVSQEVDGDQAETVVPVSVTVNPVIDAGTTDGFASWTPDVTVTEDNDISLADITDHTFIDTDGSEAVVSYTFDFNTIVADAQIGATVADAADLIANHINGTFTDNGNGTITVTPAQAAALSLDASAFPDSNVDFSIPVSALVRDTAGAVFVDKTETTNFTIDLIGDADIPTVFVNDATGLAANLIPLVLGGENTDQDSETLGRAESEDTLYYILTHTNAGASPLFNLVDSLGNQVGTPSGGGTFFLTPADLADINVITRPGPGGDIELKLTTVTIENDGDLAESSAAGTFTVEVTPNGGVVPPVAPLPPILTITPTADNEDTGFTLIGAVNPDPADPTNPSVTLLISDLPAGTTIEGAFLNVETGKWIALQADVNAGNVTITPPADFSGDLDLTFEAVAINLELLSATSGEQTQSFPVDPVADGVAISAAPGVADEDAPIDLNITLTARDGTPGNTPEDIDNTVFVRADSGTFSAGIPVLVGPFAGFTQLTLAELATLQITSDAHAHGPITIDVVASSTEPTDDADGDHTATDAFQFTVDVAAVADAPTVTVPVAPVTGDEDTAIAIPGLTAALVDADGSEVLSAKISGVPDGTLFSAGSNNGDGSWTIPVADLATLTIMPPLHYAGTMNLTLEAFALETSNGDTAATTQGFTIEVAPKADAVEILAGNVDVDASGETALDLNVRMADDRGNLPGEITPETIAITFTGVPTGASLIAGSGGTIVDNGGGSWIFTGLEAQSNDLAIKPSETSSSGTYTVNLSAVTIDGADTLATPVTDSFQVTIPTIVVGTAGVDNPLTSALADALIYGLGDNDTLNGGAGSQFLDGGTGDDTMAGGTGDDTYAVDSAGDIVTENAAEGTDTIQSSISIGALAANVENLDLTGTTDINGTGNGLDNTLTGNIGANTLNGGAGADTLVAGAGTDTLTGGTGADTFGWNAGEAGTGIDTITDFSLVDGDILDLQDLLVGFGAGSVLSDFLQTSEAAGDTTISVDINGTAEGSNFVDLVIVEGNIGLDLDDMKTNGNLIA